MEGRRKTDRQKEGRKGEKERGRDRGRGHGGRRESQSGRSLLAEGNGREYD